MTRFSGWARGSPIRGATTWALGLALLAGAASAQPDPDREKATLHLLGERTAYAAGETVVLAARVQVAPGWHVNSHWPTLPYLIATEVSLELPAGWPAPRLIYPPGRMQAFAFAEDQPLSIHDGRFDVRASFTLPPIPQPGTVPLRAVLRYQACSDRTCLPPVTTEAVLGLRVGAAGERDPDFRQPAASPSATALAVGLAVALLGGLILNVMPCVLPVLSLKLFGLAQAAGQGRRAVVRGALATLAGILVSFWVLAAAAIAARAAGTAVGWGVQFQSPAFVTFLAVVVTLFCLNLWGLFEVSLPGPLAEAAASGPRDGLAGHFAAGLFATLMATPCSAPFLGTAVGFALGQPAAVVAAVFSAMGVGMSAPYLALALAPGLARRLPRPGAWMARLKVLLGFLVAGAVVWLLYVLGGQIGTERIAAVELALLAIAMCLWLQRQSPPGANRWFLRGGAVVAALIAITTAYGGAGPAGGAAPGDLLRRYADDEPGSRIQWRSLDPEQARRLSAQGRFVFVNVTADWCFTCKVTERVVLDGDDVRDAFRRHEVVAMLGDWTNRDAAIATYLADFGRYGIPFYVLYLPGGGTHLFGELITQREVVDTMERHGRLHRRGSADES